MNSLPDELLLSIFEYLKINDLIQCSLVCKRFKLLCQDVKITDLIIANEIENIKHYWFHTNKKFNQQDAINVSTFNSYRSILRLDKLRQLYFTGLHSEYAQLKVNELTQLEQIKINLEQKVYAKDNFHINLPNLKILETKTSNWSDPMWIITAPKLEMLSCENFDSVKLTFPHSIKRLETDFYTESIHALKNLQFLLIARLEEFNWLNTLTDLPKLTTFMGEGSISTTRSIIDLIEYKCKHKLSEPKVYYLSVEAKTIDELLDVGNHFLFQIKNYSALARTDFVYRAVIDYVELMELMKGKIPDDFTKKYFRARHIQATGKIEDQEHLYRFLKSFDYLTNLVIGCDSLDQSFYNRLGELDQLTTLSIHPSEELFSESNLDFSFLLRLKRLECFFTIENSVKFFGLSLELFRQLKHFSYIIFFFKGDKVYINRDGECTTYYEILVLCYGCKEKRLDFNGLVREVNSIKSGMIDE